MKGEDLIEKALKLIESPLTVPFWNIIDNEIKKAKTQSATIVADVTQDSALKLIAVQSRLATLESIKQIPTVMRRSI